MNAKRFNERASVTTPAVVTGVSNGTGLGIVRDLGRLGVPVLAVDNNRDALGFASRYAVPSVCRDPHYDEEGFIQDMVALGERLDGSAVVFPAHDDFVTALARNAGRLAARFHLPFCGWDAMQTLVDKEQQVRAAERAAVPAPATAFVHDAEDLAEATLRVSFPAVLKPVVPLALKRRTGLKLIVVQSPGGLRQAYEQVRFSGAVMLQEVVPGDDEDIFIAATYHDAESRPLAVFTGRKLRQHPRRFGNTRLAVSEWSDEVAQLALRLLEEVRYHGVSDVEFKRDPRDGVLKFMEINARHGLWARLATASGVDLTKVAYLDAVGRPVKARRQRDGVVWADAFRDAKDSAREIARREMSVAEWMRPLLAVRADAVLSLVDPAPSVREAVSILKRAVDRRRPNLWD